MNVLLSQGMTRPGVVNPPHWGHSIAEAERIAVQSRGTWMLTPIMQKDIRIPDLSDAQCRFSRPTPPSHADPRLANRMER